MRKIGENETFVDFYKSEKQNTNPTLIAYILNAVYLTRYNETSQEFKDNIEQFVKEYKKDNESEFFSLKDLPIFKFYDIIVNEKIIASRQKIRAELSSQELLSSTILACKIFNLKKDFMYSITIDDNSFINFASSKETLENELRVLLHNGHGVVIFYMTHKDSNYTFGFTAVDDHFETISPKTLEQYCEDKSVEFTTMEEFVKEILYERN